MCHLQHPKAPLLAAVRDFGLPCGHHQLKDFGWPWVTPPGDASDPGDTPGASQPPPRYFNAGVLLLNLPALRAVQPQLQGLVEAQKQRVAAGGVALRHADQDVLNLVCWHHGGFLELSHKWNVQVTTDSMAQPLKWGGNH
jgi:lipopolysaccharide biosynthesis glycosyltransferase